MSELGKSCAHGSLKRQCLLCQMIADEFELRAKLSAVEAKVRELERKQDSLDALRYALGPSEAEKWRSDANALAGAIQNYWEVYDGQCWCEPETPKCAFCQVRETFTAHKALTGQGEGK